MTRVKILNPLHSSIRFEISYSLSLFVLAFWQTLIIYIVSFIGHWTQMVEETNWKYLPSGVWHLPSHKWHGDVWKRVNMLISYYIGGLESRINLILLLCLMYICRVGTILDVPSLWKNLVFICCCVQLYTNKTEQLH